MQDKRLMRACEVMEACSLPKTSFRRMVAEGRFPKPVKVGLRSIRWWSHEVEAWLEDLPRLEAQRFEKKFPA